MISTGRLWLHIILNLMRFDVGNIRDVSCTALSPVGFSLRAIGFIPLSFLLLGFFFLGNDADARIDLYRSGAHFKADVHTDKHGTWEIKTSAGDLCAQGELAVGDNSIDFAKVAPNLDLVFETRDLRGVPMEDAKSSGQIHLSPLPKVEGGAVIYQLAPRTYFARGIGEELTGKLADLTTERLEDLKNLGVDYVWLTGVLEHASNRDSDPDVVKGSAGSYYAIVDNWDIAPTLGDVSDLQSVVSRAHRLGLRIMIDLIPNHTARNHRTDMLCKSLIDFGKGDLQESFFHHRNNYFYLKNQVFSPPWREEGLGEDGFFDADISTPGLQSEFPAKVTGNHVVAAAPSTGDWYETAKLNYGWDFFRDTESYFPRPKTWDQMLDVAKYWLELGVDGFRVDFAHAVPMPFWRYFASEIRKVNPNVFLVAEAYESDESMKYPGFSHKDLLDSGFDSVYDSYLYWLMFREVRHSGKMHEGRFFASPAARPGMIDKGYLLTRYMENHDEVRVGSYRFAPDIPSRERRSVIGLAYTAYLGLMPGHLMLHGGQELQEDAEIYGPFSGYDGRTSIFDYVYQFQTSLWIRGQLPAWLKAFRNKYRDLLHLKRLPVFRARHSLKDPSIADLRVENMGKDEYRWIGAYLRYRGRERYVVVTNSDPFSAHLGIVYFKERDMQSKLHGRFDSDDDNAGGLYRLHRVWSTLGDGYAGLHFAAGSSDADWLVPSSAGEDVGLHLGIIPAGSTVVFRLEELRRS